MASLFNWSWERKAFGIFMTAAMVLAIIIPFTDIGSCSDDANDNPYLVRSFVDKDGRPIDEVIVPGRPPAVKAESAKVPEPNIAMGINTLSNVPAFDWSYGCSATSAAMMMGYYDNVGYSNMYSGPANGGVCPMDNSVWGHTAYPGVTCGECPLSATHNGTDGLNVKGHVDDYWVDYGSSNDPYYGNWAEHGYADCTADFMGTNQYHNWQNTDGATTFYFDTNGAPLYDFSACEGYSPPRRDGCHGMKLFVESRGYSVYYDGVNYQNYNQYIHEHVSGGFTFDQYKAEIDAGRPVLIQVEGHTMLGFGYDTAGSKVYIHDTWDYNNHQMTWGGNYSGMQHYGVTVIRLATPAGPGESQNWRLLNTDYTGTSASDGTTHHKDFLMKLTGNGSSYMNLPSVSTKTTWWYADSSAQCDLSFGENSWTLYLYRGAINSGAGSGKTLWADVYKVASDGTPTCLASGTKSFNANDAAGTWEIMCADNASTSQTFTTGERLALRIKHDASTTIPIYYYNASNNRLSRLVSPSSDPGYPVPELSSFVLVSAGLVCSISFYFATPLRRHPRK